MNDPQLQSKRADEKMAEIPLLTYLIESEVIKMEKEKTAVRIIDNYNGEDKYLLLTKDQIKLLRWLDLNEYLSDYTKIKFDIEIPELIEI